MIIPAIKLECNLRINTLTERITDFQEKFIRLQLVQENKKLMPMILGENGLFLSESDVSSDISDISGTSGKKSSSKNRFSNYILK